MQRATVLAFAAGVAAAGTGLFVIGLAPEHDEHAGHDHTDHADHADHAMSPEEEMEAYMATIMPGEHHAAMRRSVGSWTAKTSFVMTPDTPPVEGVGTMEAEWVLGGRYIQGHFHMDDMMGMPFDGISYAGYDNIRQEYVTAWMDTFGTGILRMTGHVHENGQHVMVGKTAMPEGEREMKIVTVWQDDDNFVDRFYDQMPDGSWNQSGTITYTRR
ncbi:MAG: DUF1579 family protein [Phycisphaerales bacterium]